MCCVGQALLAISHHRGMSHLVKITEDANTGKKLLKEKSDSIPTSNAKLFRDKFRKDLKKLGVQKEKVGKIANAIRQAKKETIFLPSEKW